jgi:hypothetical protein
VQVPSPTPPTASPLSAPSSHKLQSLAHTHIVEFQIAPYPNTVACFFWHYAGQILIPYYIPDEGIGYLPLHPEVLLLPTRVRDV